MCAITQGFSIPPPGWSCSNLSMVCSWNGVGCSGNGFVNILNIAQGVSGTISTLIGSLTSLNQLTIQHSSVLGNIPTEIGLLHNLITLSVYDTCLGGTIPTTIGLTSLRFLTLDSSHFTGRLYCKRLYVITVQ